MVGSLLPNVLVAFVFFAVSIDVVASTSVISTDEIGSGLTLLSNNDLLNNPDPDSGAIFLDTTESYKSAEETCHHLGETLWVGRQGSEFPLNTSLSYLVYAGLVPKNQLFWAGAENPSSPGCEAVDLSGQHHPHSCNETLPVLCTQSAPISNVTFDDKSTTYQIAHRAGSITLTGFRDHYAWKFLGVRYALQPKRFEWSTPWSGSGSASALNFTPDCPQQPHDFPGPFNEDCLFLSIWTPYLPQHSNTGKGLRPVMMYLYGGGLFSGSTTNPHTDCTNLASRGDVVCIAINYRLGNLGFLVFDDGIHQGNYGIQDIITALQWVQQNIAAFGGDPSTVTIFGESGGADAIRALLASPKATGLFSRAIIMSAGSGVASYGPYANYSSVQTQYKAVTRLVLNMTGCATALSPINCLRDYDAEALVSLGYNKTKGDWALAANAFYPVLDGTILPSSGIAALNGGPRYNPSVSVMTGTNLNEFGMEIPEPTSPSDPATSYLNNLSAQVGYPMSSLFALASVPIPVSAEDVFRALDRIGTDGGFRCLDEAMAFSAARHSAFAAMYRFEFNRTYQPASWTNGHCSAPRTQARPAGDPDGEYMKCHAGEKIYVFGNLAREGDMPDRDGKDILMSQYVLDMWASFARTGDPNPDEAYLKVKGYWATLDRLRSRGKWEPVAEGRPSVRLLQWDAKQVDFGGPGSVCDALGLPLDYYETAVY